MQSDAQASSQGALIAQYAHKRILAYTNRPDPLEPVAGLPSVQSVRNGLTIVPHHEWQLALLAPSQENRRKEADLLALPKPLSAEIRQQPRLPPTLSGLHQPPPEARLLPSISRHTTAAANPPAAPKQVRAKKRVASKQERQEKRTTRTRWTEAETSDLMKGVARFGIGKWTAILNCAEYNFPSRTALDLKDRFRVCRPADYCTSRPSSRPNSKAELSADDMARMGLSSFEPVSRKKRHHYTDNEDKQLVRGFQRHGKQWARIQQDTELQLAHRTRTDLRDRLRTKFPELFEQTTGPARAPEAPQHILRNPADTLISPTRPFLAPQTAHLSNISAQTPSQILPSMPLLELDWSDFRIPASDMERSVTLDRHILKWPHDPTRTPASGLQSSPRDRSGLIDDNDKPAHAFLTFEELLS